MYHEPVLTKQVLYYLITNKNGIYLDGTAGGGGHSEAILNSLSEKGSVISMDMDDEAIEFTKARLKKFGSRSIVAKANFRSLLPTLQKYSIERVNGIILDLGVSSRQIDDGGRGFSFGKTGPLDMRMDVTAGITAKEVVNSASQSELARIFKEYGEERYARRVAGAIIRERQRKTIETTSHLAELISAAIPASMQVKSLARIFQAIRIYVNEELNNLRLGLEAGVSALAVGGRMVVLSYHSLEDRTVKHFFRSEASRCECPPEIPMCICNKQDRLKILTKRVLTASAEEKLVNTRSRSAKLRAAELLSTG